MGDYSIDMQPSILTAYIDLRLTESSVSSEDLVGNLITLYGLQILYSLEETAQLIGKEREGIHEALNLYSIQINYSGLPFGK